MLNITNPLYEDSISNNIEIVSSNLKNISFDKSEPYARPTLNKIDHSSYINDFTLEEKSKKESYQFKIILIGSISVGKTSIISRYITNTFNTSQQSTITVECKTKPIKFSNDKVASLNIWDTCGQEKFRTITRQHYKKANGILLVFDLTNRPSFESVETWYKDIKDNAPSDAEIILVGNKCDLINQRKISNEEGEQLADKFGMIYKEVSAKNGDNIYLLFETISEKMIENFQNKSKESLNNLNKIQIERNKLNSEIKVKKGCCK